MELLLLGSEYASCRSGKARLHCAHRAPGEVQAGIAGKARPAFSLRILAIAPG
jgi:hypothetical protein